MSPSLQQAHHHPPKGSPFHHHNSTCVCPHIRLMTMKQKNPMTSNRMSLIRHWRGTYLLCKETGIQTWAKMLVETDEAFVDPSAMMTQMRGLILLEFATFNDLVLANTSGHHKASRRWTWHSPNGQHHNQIDYILVRKRFRLGVNIARTQSFPGADIGSDHDLLMMTFHLHLKRVSKPKHMTQVWPWKSWKIPVCWKPSKLW